MTSPVEPLVHEGPGSLPPLPALSLWERVKDAFGSMGSDLRGMLRGEREAVRLSS